MRAEREEEALRRRQEEKSKPAAVTASPFARASPASAVNGSTAPPLIPTAVAAGGWRNREASKAEAGAGSASPAASSPGGRVPSVGGAYRPPAARGPGPASPASPFPSSRSGESKPSPFGAARPREETLSKRDDSPAPSVGTAAKDADGSQPAAAPKWKPRSRMGPGDAPPR